LPANAAHVPSVVTVNAASYGETIAPGAIAAGFGVDLATRSERASGLPLPVALGGTSVRLIDSRVIEHLAQLFFVSSGQVNYLIPEEAALGAAQVIITTTSGAVSTGELIIANSAPALFTFSANGRGVPVALTTFDGALYDPVVNHDGSAR